MLNVQRNNKWSPAISCWICHILDARYIPEEGALDTIFGKIERVRILGTVIDKQEHIFSDSFDENQGTLGLKFIIDDGTGIIEVYLGQIESNRFNLITIGDLVDIVGGFGVGEKSYLISSIKIMRKVENPDFKLLRDADIIEKLQSSDIKKDLIKNGKNHNEIDLKEKVYELIEQYSEDANGISFTELKNKLNINENDLRNIIRDLEIESLIYPAEKDFFQCF